MGEPGHFAADDLRYLISNVTVAVKCLGNRQLGVENLGFGKPPADAAGQPWLKCQLSIPLIGTRRQEMSVEEALRGFLEGILDGYQRFAVIADAVTYHREHFVEAVRQPLFVALVEADQDRAKQIYEALKLIAEDSEMKAAGAAQAAGPCVLIKELRLEVGNGTVAPDPILEPSPRDTDPDIPVTLLRVTRRASAATTLAPTTGRPPGVATGELFQYSALSEAAAVAVREVELNSHLLSLLPDRLTNGSPAERESFGTFFADYLIPEDFRPLTEGPAGLTLVVDETTAAYPWEMAARKRYARTNFLGTRLAVSRQFRTTQAPAPSSPPPLNQELKVLLIADPAAASPNLPSLPHARDEALAVVDVLNNARLAWRDEYVFKVTVRVGSDQNPESPQLETIRRRYDWVDAGRCNPLELASLIVSEHFDVIHYAGHGALDRATRRAGWVFDQNCFLSAADIFRVRQVPRLVFANACFSAVTTDRADQRGQGVGLAQAFFALGIPNYIGPGWQVDDACALECARWFYTYILSLHGPTDDEIRIGRSPPAVIGYALRDARRRTFQFSNSSSSWGAYQHYGRIGDKLLPLPNVRSSSAAVQEPLQPNTSVRDITAPSDLGGKPVSPNSPKAAAAATPTTRDSNLIYFNGIDPDTGNYAVPPMALDVLAKQVRERPGVSALAEVHGEAPRSFAVPFGLDLTNLADVGWAVVFPADAPQDVRNALAPLIEHRRKQAGDLLKVLDYKKGEQVRDWYRRHHISAGNFEATVVPYYLLLVGPPTSIPFEFQYLIGVEYAVGRLTFDTAAEYGKYAASVVAYETAEAIRNAKEIVYWGTRHLGDPATNLSASLLIDPLANGVAGATGTLKTPVHARVGYARKVFSGDEAVRDALLSTLHTERPPAALFTASHGMAVKTGRPNQVSDNGGLLCQDWPGFGTVRREHYLAAADVADDANVNGVVAFLFACFGGGTPDVDQFLTNLAQAATAPLLASQPFVAALPRRLLAHPRGSALAVVAHVDRAWGFSIQPSKMTDAQIGPFYQGLCFILDGSPVGHAVAQQFGQRFAALSTALLGGTSPTTRPEMRPSDRDLVTYWLERNDAQNYVVLGDPAARIRKDALA
jgi:hypothetical protein